MLLVYYPLVALLYVVALPFLLYLRFKPKYNQSIPARFFLKKSPSFAPNGIWFHACSFGEVRSLAPFLEHLEEQELRISVITQTGFQEAKRYQKADVRYLPYELFLPFWIKQQSVLVVMEAELWPLLFIVSKLKNTRTVLVNARISDRSYRSYKRFAWFYRWIFKHVDLVLAQSESDKTRLHELGALNVEAIGNIKQFQRYDVTRKIEKRDDRRVVVLASTHEGEEALLLKHLNFKSTDCIVVVPRHPERFKAVNTLLEAYAIETKRTYQRFSDNASFQSDVVLCDAMGELINIYAIADVVILGGSFVQGVGGHNPLEPAYFGVKLISGEFIFNQKVLFHSVENSVICSLEELPSIFDKVDQLPTSCIPAQESITPLVKKILG